MWSLFRRAAPSQNLSIDYVKGEKGAKPLPLFIKPDQKLDVRDVMQLMRDHFEGTEFDLTKDVGAGPYKLPYRWRPMGFNALIRSGRSKTPISSRTPSIPKRGPVAACKAIC